MVEAPNVEPTPAEQPTNADQEWVLPKKVASNPTVMATYDVATKAYLATKDYNSWTQYTANFAEKAAGAVAQPLYNASLPVLNRFEPTLHQADKYAAGKLDQLEEKAPVISKPPSEIYQQAKDVTVDTINQSYVGQAVNYALKPVLGVAERWTPNGTSDEPTSEESIEKAATSEAEGSKGVSEDQEDVTLQQTVKRAYHVGSKLQQRALEKAMENVTALRKRSQESLDSLRHAVDLIQYVKTLESATGADKVRDFFADILEDDLHDSQEHETKTEGDETTTAESGSKADLNRKTLVVSRNLTKKLRIGYEQTITHAKPYLNEAMFQRLQHGQKLLDGIQQSFYDAKTLKDVSDTFIETTKKNLNDLAIALKDISRETMHNWLGKTTPEQDLDVDGSRGDISSRSDSYTPSESLDEDPVESQHSEVHAEPEVNQEVTGDH